MILLMCACCAAEVWEIDEQIELIEKNGLYNLLRTINVHLVSVFNF